MVRPLASWVVACNGARITGRGCIGFRDRVGDTARDFRRSVDGGNHREGEKPKSAHEGHLLCSSRQCELRNAAPLTVSPNAPAGKRFVGSSANSRCTRSNLTFMGFLKPEMPQIDIAEWSKGTRSEKIRPMARHWAEVGFGTPVVMHLFYVVKILLYILGGWLFAVATTAAWPGPPTCWVGTRSRSCSRRSCSTPCCSR